MRSIEFESGLKLSNMLPGKSGNSVGLTENALLLSRGRDSIKAIIYDMGLPGDSGILLPSFACGEIYEPFSKAGLRNVFYRVNEDLTPNLSHIREIKDEAKAIVIINYFGFLQPEQVYNQCKDWGLIVIEDGSHSFLSKDSGKHGDYYFASMRKLLPLLDGAILKKKNGSGFNKPNVKHSLPAVKFRFFRALGQLIKTSDNRHSRGIKRRLINEMFSNAEKTLGMFPSPAGMSKLSANILEHLDIHSVSIVRRRNYMLLRDGLKQIKDFAPVFSDLPDDIVPYGFPIFVERRRLWVHALNQLNIQTAPLWNLSGLIPQDIIKDRVIYEQTLLFPIGQDYKEEDMHSLIERAKRLYWDGSRT